jgi:hypothetical protein
MTDEEVAVWVAEIVVVLTIWRAVHGPYSDEWWRSALQYYIHYLPSAEAGKRSIDSTQ